MKKNQFARWPPWKSKDIVASPFEIIRTYLMFNTEFQLGLTGSSQNQLKIILKIHNFEHRFTDAQVQLTVVCGGVG